MKPVVVAILAPIFLGEIITAKTIGLIFISIIGMILVIDPRYLGISLPGESIEIGIFYFI